MSRLPANYRASMVRPTEPDRPGQLRCEVCLDVVEPALECLVCRMRRCELHAGPTPRLYSSGWCCDDHRPGSHFGPKPLPLGGSSWVSTFKEKVDKALARLNTPAPVSAEPWRPVVVGMEVPTRAKSLKVAAGAPWTVNATYRDSAVVVRGTPPDGASFAALWTDNEFNTAWIWGNPDGFRVIGSGNLQKFVASRVAKTETLF